LKQKKLILDRSETLFIQLRSPKRYKELISGYTINLTLKDLNLSNRLEILWKQVLLPYKFIHFWDSNVLLNFHFQSQTSILIILVFRLRIASLGTKRDLLFSWNIQSDFRMWEGSRLQKTWRMLSSILLALVVQTHTLTHQKKVFCTIIMIVGEKSCDSLSQMMMITPESDDCGVFLELKNFLAPIEWFITIDLKTI